MNSDQHKLPESETQPAIEKAGQSAIAPVIEPGLSESLRQQYLGVMGIQTWYDPALDYQAIEPLVPLETSATEQSNASQRLDVSDSETAQPEVEPPDAEQPGSSAELKNNLSPATLVNESATTSTQLLTMDELTKRIQQCQLCELHAARQQAVSGEGNEQASLFIISAAPVSDESLFTTQDKRMLGAMLQGIAIDLAAVYLTSLVKCRPPENRAPYTSEMICCDDHLSAQIQLIQPKAILILGEKASQQLLLSQKNLTDLRLRRHLHLGIPVYASYHPAEIINSAENKRKVWQDLLQIKQQLV